MEYILLHGEMIMQRESARVFTLDDTYAMIPVNCFETEKNIFSIKTKVLEKLNRKFDSQTYSNRISFRK